ncbi:MAG: methionyl-tRNA formyltransferase [Pseudomonadota bacterium]
MKGIIIFATGARGVAVIERLIADGHEVAGIIVPIGQPPSDLAELAYRHGCHLSAPEDVNSSIFLDLLARRGVELSIVAGFPTIFGQALIDLPRRGTINLHAGRLPAYRGGSPLQWQMINGEAEAGISVIRMDSGIDTGPLLAEASISIDRDATIADLQSVADGQFADLVAQCVAGLSDDSLVERPQSGQGNYWHQRNDADGRVEFARLSAKQVYDLVRAITRPYPGAFSFLGKDLVRLWKVDVASTAMSGVPGRIVWLQGQGPYVICREGAVLVRDLEIDGAETPKLRTGQRLT